MSCNNLLHYDPSRRLVLSRDVGLGLRDMSEGTLSEPSVVGGLYSLCISKGRCFDFDAYGSE